MRRVVSILLCVAVPAIGLLTGCGLIGGQGQEAGAAVPPTSAPTAVAAAPAAPPTAAPPASTSQDVVMEVTEGELQSELTSMLVGKSLGSTPLGDATVQSVSVALRDRQIQVSGSARAGFLNAPFAAAGTVTPDPGGRLKVSIPQASVGGVDLPEAARVSLADLLQTEVNGMFADRSMKVRTVEIADGKMRVVGTPGS
jgi:hypothetical protein